MSNIKAHALNEGETIKFTDYAMTNMETRYGEATLIEFAAESGEIHRKVFVPRNSQLLTLLRERPEASTVTLKKYLTDGEYKKPVWLVE